MSTDFKGKVHLLRIFFYNLNVIDKKYIMKFYFSIGPSEVCVLSKQKFKKYENVLVLMGGFCKHVNLLRTSRFWTVKVKFVLCLFQYHHS